MRVAYYSPLPPERSGVAEYSALLLPALRRRMEVVLARRGRRPPEADGALYHVGNDPEAHGWIVAALRRRPGVVVLHDFVLHHLVVGMTLARGDRLGYVQAMEQEYGRAGRLLALGVIEGRLPPLWKTSVEDFPLAGTVLRHATAVLVHSRHVEERVRAAGFAGPVIRTPYPAWPVPAVAAADIAGFPVIGCFGHVNSSKRIPQLLHAFTQLLQSWPDARLVIVGPLAERFDLAVALEQFGLARSPSIVCEGYVSAERLWALMAAADVCVSLRWPTMGETSASVVQALSLGKPLVVSEVGWFSELPDGAALRIAVDEHEVELLAATLDLLARDARIRAQLSDNARAYARSWLDVEQAADVYTAALEAAAGRESATPAATPGQVFARAGAAHDRNVSREAG